MSGSNPTRCFTCGEPAGDPPVLNRLSDGRPCPACAERALEALPSLLPRETEEPQTQNGSALSMVRGHEGEDAGSWSGSEEAWTGDEPEPA